MDRPLSYLNLNSFRIILFRVILNMEMSTLSNNIVFIAQRLAESFSQICKLRHWQVCKADIDSEVSIMQTPRRVRPFIGACNYRLIARHQINRLYGIKRSSDRPS